jgi:HEPN domain-containing protein
MNETVREWRDKGQKDLESASLEMSRGNSANFDLVCFLSQQGVEKLMKGAIIARSAIPPKTHDLVKLQLMLQSVHKSWDWEESELIWLSSGAVIYRYPGEDADFDVAQQSLTLALKLRGALLPLLEGSK